MTPPVIHRVTHARSGFKGVGVAVRQCSSAPISMCISRPGSVRNRSSGTAGCWWDGIRFSSATALRPAISRPISPVSWPGATGVFPAKRRVQRFRHGRAARPRWRVRAGRDGASIPPMPGGSISRRARRISTTSAAAPSISPAASPARSRRKPGLRRRIISAVAALGLRRRRVRRIAMIRVLNVDLTGEALRAGSRRIWPGSAQPELAAMHLVRSTARSHRGDAAFCHCVYRGETECSRSRVRRYINMPQPGACSGHDEESRAISEPRLRSGIQDHASEPCLSRRIAFDGSAEFHLQSHKTNEKAVSTRTRAKRSSTPSESG